MCGIVGYTWGRNAVEVRLAGLRRRECPVAAGGGCGVERPRNLAKSVTVE